MSEKYFDLLPLSLCWEKAGGGKERLRLRLRLSAEAMGKVEVQVKLELLYVDWAAAGFKDIELGV